MPFIPLLLFVRAHWKAAAGGLALMLLALGWFWFQHVLDERTRLRSELAQARSAVIVEKAQGSLNTAVSEAADRASTQALTITVRSQELAAHVQVQPGAETPLPDDLRRATLDAIGELRRQSASAAQPEHPASAQPARGVPAP